MKQKRGFNFFNDWNEMITYCQGQVRCRAYDAVINYISPKLCNLITCSKSQQQVKKL